MVLYFHTPDWRDRREEGGEGEAKTHYKRRSWGGGPAYIYIYIYIYIDRGVSIAPPPYLWKLPQCRGPFGVSSTITLAGTQDHNSHYYLGFSGIPGLLLRRLI